MLRDEIQAYLDAYNIREGVISETTGKIVKMVDGLKEIDGVFFYLYDGLSSTGIRPMDDDRVLVYYECCDPNETMTDDQVADTTLAKHFFDLTKFIWEARLYDSQFEYVKADGEQVTNSGWSVDAGDDELVICSKTSAGVICSRYVYATRETTHEWR